MMMTLEVSLKSDYRISADMSLVLVDFLSVIVITMNENIWEACVAPFEDE